MEKITSIEQAIRIAKDLKKSAKHIVLAGGCFDILHIGHVTFLEKAKAQGNVLFVFLESDTSIKKLKGSNRPVNNQQDRSKILASLTSVDFIIILPAKFTDMDYGDLITNLRPDVIAVTKGDPFKKQKEIQAGNAGGKVVEVTGVISDISTSRLINLLGEEL